MKIGQRFIIFQMGIYFWGAEIHCVKEIVKNVPMEKCTTSFPEAVGTLHRDDHVIPVVDLHKKFYKEYLPACGDIFHVIFIFCGKLIAVPVNMVEQQYCEVPDDCLFPVPAVIKTGSKCIEQIINFDGRLILVLSLESLFEGVEGCENLKSR